MTLLFTFIVITAFTGLILWALAKGYSDYEDEFFKAEENLPLNREEEDDGIPL